MLPVVAVTLSTIASFTTIERGPFETDVVLGDVAVVEREVVDDGLVEGICAEDVLLVSEVVDVADVVGARTVEVDAAYELEVSDVAEELPWLFGVRARPSPTNTTITRIAVIRV